MKVSLLIAYRNRSVHLAELIKVLASSDTKNIIELVVIEGNDTPTLADMDFNLPNYQYHFVKMDEVFHKTKLLNVGLDNASCKYVIPYDVDLIPFNNAIENSLKVAELSTVVLPTGYRLMCPTDYYQNDFAAMAVAAEDSERALKKHLIGQEKFGVCPVFEKKKLIAIGGWHEQYTGWGAEDQDIIERYCSTDILIGRFPSILYIHLDHGVASGWNEPELIKRNREIYKNRQLV